MDNLKIQEFWDNYTRFLNTIPTTEQPNPKSYNLSDLCSTNLVQAFQVFRDIEQDAILALSTYLPEIIQLQQAVQTALNNNSKIFLIGCGASGRLSVLLKRLWDKYYPNKNSQIVAVAAGGDISLIKSIEQFEDKEEFGIKQLQAQGYTKNDLVIGLSASGESPFIISALNYAKITSIYKPYLICNNAQQSIINRNTMLEPLISSINTLSLDVGPMALTGSTRLQATTAMQIVCAIAILNKNPENTIKEVYQLVQSINFDKFSIITDREAKIIKNKEFVLYSTNDPILGLSLLADNTERSPTFNLSPFENQDQLSNIFSPFYVSLNTEIDVNNCWINLLGHPPICLSWPDFIETDPQYIQGFDLSNNSKRASNKYLPSKQDEQIWNVDNDLLTITFNTNKFNIRLPKDQFERTIIYKTLLNSHSTLLMGRLGYFYGNLMIALRPSNHKLIDRTIRYAIFILKTKHHLDVDYKTVANTLFNEIDQLKPNESIVLKVVNSLLKEVT